MYENDIVKDVKTGRVGRLYRIQVDNSCGDPECCGSAGPDTYWVRFSADPRDTEDYYHYDRYDSDLPLVAATKLEAVTFMLLNPCV